MQTQRRAIFIGGVGRSGTTILRHLLDQHPRIYSIPLETRFIVDADGVYDLYRNLTRDYSPVRGREALFRFDRMMRHYMAAPTSTPYAGYDLPALCGAELYWRELDRLVHDLTSSEFESVDHSVNQAPEPRLVAWARKLDRAQRRLRGLTRPVPMAEGPRRRLRYARYFADPAQLLARLGDYVDSLFASAARRNGKDVWCEKTPHNLMHAPFLLEMLPHAIFVHIVRDPRAVAGSLLKQPWATNSAEDCCRSLVGYHTRWRQLRTDPIMTDDRCIELRFEDLAADPTAALAPLFAACGLPETLDDIQGVRPEHTKDWRVTLSPADVQLIETQLGPLMDHLPRIRHPNAQTRSAHP
jgi:hypothetical protein